MPGKKEKNERSEVKDSPTMLALASGDPNAGIGRLFSGLWRKKDAIFRLLREASKSAPLLALLVRPSLDGSGIESESFAAAGGNDFAWDSGRECAWKAQ